MITEIAVLLVVALGAACQVLSGMGFALVASPLLIVVLGQAAGLRVVLVLSILLNLSVLARLPGRVRFRDAVHLLIPAVLVIVPVGLVSDRLQGPAMDALAGSAVLAATALSAAGRSLRFFERPGGAVLAGGSSGALNVLAGASGVPVALFAAARRWSPAQTTATLQAYALPLNLVTLAAVGLPPTAGRWDMLWALAGLGVGLAAALPFAERFPASVLRPLTLGVAAVGGATLLWAAVRA